MLPRDLPIRILDKHQSLYRVYKESLKKDGTRAYGPEDYNAYPYLKLNNGQLKVANGDCAFWSKAVYRFSPVVDETTIVPAIYLGTSDIDAFHETIIRRHDLPTNEAQTDKNNAVKHKPIVAKDLAGRYLVNLFLKRRLSFCDLSRQFLKGEQQALFDFTAAESVESKESVNAYKRCHEIANAIYHHKDNVDGLFWESRHLENNFNLVIWDRLGTKAPLMTFPGPDAVPEKPLFEGEGLMLLQRELDRCKIPASALALST